MSKYQQQNYNEPYEEEEYIEDQDYGQQLPTLPQHQQLPQQPQKPFNPYYDGIKSAIAEARESFRSTDEQNNRALRQGILSFGESIGGMERERGFKNNLLAAGRALAPAIKSYDEMETASENANFGLANKIIAKQQAMEARKLQQSNREEDLKFKEKELEMRLGSNDRNFMERMRHNKAQENINEKRFLGEQSFSQEEKELDKIAPRIRTDSAFDNVGKKTNAAGAFYNEALDVKEKYEDLKRTMAKNGVDVSNPLAFQAAIRKYSSLISSFTKNPKHREIAKKYADVTASNKRMMQTAEKALKDGALTNFTVKYGDQNDLFPNFNENFDVYETKLNHLIDDAAKGYESSDLSLRLGRHVNKQNYDIIKKLMSKQESIESGQTHIPQEIENELITPTELNPEFIKVRNNKGEVFRIPEELLNNARLEGMELVE